MTENRKEVSLEFLLQVTENNKEEIKSFIEDVLSLKKDTLPLMNNALLNKDFITLKEGAHKLKSAIKIFGLGSLQGSLEEVETSASENDFTQVKELMVNVNNLFPLWEKELDDAYNSLQ